MNKALKRISRFIPDKLYLNLVYYYFFHEKLNLKNPKTYNEKVQWLKLYDRNPIYTILVDKYEVKKFVSKKIGEEYIIPTISVYDNVNEIDIQNLPNQFVLKTTHDSGGVRICDNKENFDIEEAKHYLNNRMKQNYYYVWREWPYKNVKPRIIAEEYMQNINQGGLDDFKFFCFNGKVKYLFVATERQSKEETKFDFYDREFNHLTLINGHPNSTKKITKPITFEKMIDLAEKLSKDIPHVRVDFYSIGEKILFGELTFYHWSGLTPFEPEVWNEMFGKEIKLPIELEGQHKNV